MVSQYVYTGYDVRQSQELVATWASFLTTLKTKKIEGITPEICSGIVESFVVRGRSIFRNFNNNALTGSKSALEPLRFHNLPIAQDLNDVKENLQKEYHAIFESFADKDKTTIRLSLTSYPALEEIVLPQDSPQ